MTGHRVLVTAALIVALGLAIVASAEAKVRTCPSSTGGAAGIVDKFTKIKARGVGCTKAHEVLGTWANSAPGASDLGFTCTATKTSSDAFTVKCREGAKQITAHEKQGR